MILRLSVDNKIRFSNICPRSILEFFGHVLRKDENNLEKLVVTGQIGGKRPRGRSLIRWTGQIRTTPDITIHDEFHKAMDRNKWQSNEWSIIKFLTEVSRPSELRKPTLGGGTSLLYVYLHC
ncbi:unnamed protein product [Chrysodeixis includens]|uniref:Uncharacterized protein n=1 Tax=Chrysodeixis includens TaxID=689277 RepID=A0A9P0C1E3_CHRIL|nr:unnamed protein product [Chrysodeixis includens]